MSDHISKAFEQELLRLKNLIATMGDLAIEQMEAALRAAERRDSSQAAGVIAREPQADRLEHEIDRLVIHILALRQPMAIDLRHVLSSLRTGIELERICDHAKDMAERATSIPAIDQARLGSVTSLGRFAIGMVRDATQAYQLGDTALSDKVWSRDKELDEMYTALFGELLAYMTEDPKRISAGTQMLFIARDIERIGDLATNIAEMTRYLVVGVPVEDERPKADKTKSLMLPAGR